MAKRIAVIEREKCVNGSSCEFLCGKVCPVNRGGKECIIPNPEDNKPLIDEALCIGCGICVHRCPVECISVINLPEELEKDPIHRYGQNAFELFNLPIPIFGKVVGIIGRNGIGKSTAIKVLAGVLKPNLGNLDQEPDYDKLIEFFKGTEAQSFFEKVKAGEIKISYKPQQVDLLAKTTKGIVRELLQKVDEKQELEKIAKELDIENILDNDISKISGGELQRVAIAASVLKKANLYVFDEPTSYLDIKQRIKVSKFIRNLADDKTAVLVVEHDLIILDYMTDMIHIMYGKEGVYGIVSGPKTTKTGINVYLSGYLKEENVRFRDKAIKFEIRPPEQVLSSILLTEWRDIQKTLGNFKLTAKHGQIMKKDIIGVLGENGIGKTSFVKVLAEDEKQDNGNVLHKITVSYKPQYIDTESNELVMNVLREAIQKSSKIINQLNIQPLFTKKLKELSGGELQRVAIADCLAKDVNLYLLDEPSAYLDIEQRLAVSKVLRDLMELKGKTAIVVDHDLLFLDYLSKKLLVFDGKPARSGDVKGPYPMEEGMNLFLEDLGITFRRDLESNRPRANKEESLKDREQKTKRRYYYS